MSSHIYPGTTTRIAGEINNILQHMRAIDANLPQINAILAQCALDGEAALAEQTGYADAADAVAERALLTSLEAELAVSPFWQQALARRG